LFKPRYKQFGITSIYFKNTFFSRKSILYDLRIAEQAVDFFHNIAGNYIVIKHDEKLYSFYSHLHCNSIQVSEGDLDSEGDLIGEVGDSGHSASPQLHFQLMDRAEVWDSTGIPCNFFHYDEYIDGEWIERKTSVPGQPYKIRFN
jgi:murein DD-endopeptidase MepM/ murein hydrolase activator NlpD